MIYSSGGGGGGFFKCFYISATDEDDFDPKFITFPESKHAAEGSAVSFECKIAGSDAIKGLSYG